MDGDIIYHLWDGVHVMKRVRDNLLDHGFYFEGVLLEKAMFERLLEAIGTSDERVAPKLSESHINVKKQDRHVILLRLTGCTAQCTDVGFTHFWSSRFTIATLVN